MSIRRTASMPDPILMAQAMGGALLASAVVLALLTWCGRRRTTRSSWVDAGWVLGLGAGIYVGCWMLGLWPHWPPLEDLDRLLILVIPAVLVVELVAAIPHMPQWLPWVIRLVVAGSAARVMLHGSSYLADLGGPEARLWSPAQAWLILGLLGAALATVWIVLALLARTAPGVSLVVSLAVATVASALSIMMSGYATGGQAGLPLAGALLGGSIVGLVLAGAKRQTAPLGVGIVSLFSLLIMGRFFGELLWAHAVVLFCAPLVAWLPELPGVRRMPPWARGIARVVLVGIVVSGVVGDAARRFAAESSPASTPGSPEPANPEDLYYGR
jgi:hypothetical protein